MEHAFYMPKPYGRLYAEEEDKSVILTLKKELLPEEEQSEFAKYYHMGPCKPNEETLAMMSPDKELDKKHAFMPEEYKERMFHPGFNEYENGYCVMDNGVVYISLLSKQTGVNDENMKYFNDNFANGTGDLFYKTWCPGEHLRLYPDLAIENMGWGWAEVRITGFLTKEDLGITEDITDVDPEFIDFQAMNLEVLPLGAPQGTEPIYLVEANWFRQNEAGREIRHRFWLGLNIKDGKSVVKALADREQAAEYARNTMFHSGSEFATLTRNVVEFYKDRMGK